MTSKLLQKHLRSPWQPPGDWNTITTIDAHTAGEPLRIITGGFPPVAGDTILERRAFARKEVDHFRTALMWEPRGHADMYGCIITPPVSPEADFGVLFLHNEGYSTMCGHGIIAVTKVVLETGMLPANEPETRIKIDTPAGLVTAYARISGGSVDSVYFYNVPAFVQALARRIEVPGIGEISYDIAFGGAFYAFVNAQEAGVRCHPDDYRNLIDRGIRIKKAVMSEFTFAHPFENDLNFLYGTIFVGAAEDERSHSRNVCVFADGEVDRCPTGTGVSARMALHHAREEIGIGEPAIIESIIGSTFTASVAEETVFGDYRAVIPRVEGQAFITGVHSFVIDPKDPLKNGFMLR